MDTQQFSGFDAKLNNIYTRVRKTINAATDELANIQVELVGKPFSQVEGSTNIWSALTQYEKDALLLARQHLQLLFKKLSFLDSVFSLDLTDKKARGVQYMMVAHASLTGLEQYVRECNVTIQSYVSPAAVPLNLKTDRLERIVTEVDTYVKKFDEFTAHLTSDEFAKTVSDDSDRLIQALKLIGRIHNWKHNLLDVANNARTYIGMVKAHSER
jgi:hypothetical protein